MVTFSSRRILNIACQFHWYKYLAVNDTSSSRDCCCNAIVRKIALVKNAFDSGYFHHLYYYFHWASLIPSQWHYLFWGGSNQKYNVPVAQALDFWGIKIPQVKLLVVVLAILVILVLHYLLQNTKIGKAMRAVADDIDLARVSGINVDKIVLWTWVIAGSLTSLGGSMLGLSEAVRPNMGWFLILPLFASVILGGIGNPYGAIAAAFIIGIAQEVSTPLLGSQYKQGVALLIMILVLLIRPKGLFRGTI